MNEFNPKVTAAAVVERQGHYLIVREHTPDGIRLNQPAGHLDPLESLIHAAARETLEETGWTVEPTGLIGMYLSRYQSQDRETDVTYLRFTFLCRPVSHDPDRLLDDGIIEALWMSPEDIRQSVSQHRSPQVLRSLEDHLAGRLYSLDCITTDPRCLQL